MTDQPPKEGELILYRTADKAVRIEMLYGSKTFWLDHRHLRAVQHRLRHAETTKTFFNTVQNKLHWAVRGRTAAKNYLIEGELQRIVSMYLDYAENRAGRQIAMKMADWVQKLDAFLKFNEYEVLTNASKVSKEVADRLAEERYAEFRIRQDRELEGDFEAEVKRVERTRS
jgi:hypothetical protein